MSTIPSTNSWNARSAITTWGPPPVSERPQEMPVVKNAVSYSIPRGKGSVPVGKHGNTTSPAFFPRLLNCFSKTGINSSLNWICVKGYQCTAFARILAFLTLVCPPSSLRKRAEGVSPCMPRAPAFQVQKNLKRVDPGRKKPRLLQPQIPVPVTGAQGWNKIQCLFFPSSLPFSSFY